LTDDNEAQTQTRFSVFVIHTTELKVRRLPLVLLLLPLVACGGGSPSAPTPQTPNVVGNYSGSTVISAPELGGQITCPTTTTVTQSGTTVTIAPLVLGGECDNISIPLEQVTIDNTGAIQGQNSGTFDEPSCGRYTYTGSGGFFGRELRLSLNATSSTCPNFNLTMTLSR
jgi:hypothetical protein